MQSLWDRFSTKSEFGYISHLQKGADWDQREFEIVGSRFVEQMLLRFKDYSDSPFNESSILEIGCGIGRFLKPLAGHFRKVVGVDISTNMLSVAESYLEGFNNTSLLLCDGHTLSVIDDEEFEYCISAGVFQHITSIEVIHSYTREALRVLKPGGLFLFQFEGTRKWKSGAGIIGAKINAKGLNEALKDEMYSICEISMEQKNSIGTMVILLRKLGSHENQEMANMDFISFNIMDRPWVLGVYNDIKTKAVIKDRIGRKYKRRITFYD